MTKPRDEARALRFMVDEVRAEPVPAVDWERVEGELLDRIARRDRPKYEVARPEAPSAFGRVIGYMAVAAAIALAFGAGSSAGDARPLASVPRVVAVESVPMVAASASSRDVSRLEVGDAVETGAEPVTFELSGSVRWTLGPQSRAVVRARAIGGIGHVVALERGAIEAEVVPRPASEGFVEAFAVEAGGTRVAVHGTLFRVVREHDRIIVDVEHGTVAVGPTGHVGVTTGRILVGPARASFSLDGARSARRLDRNEPIAVASQSAVEPAHSAVALAAGAVEPEQREAQNDRAVPAPLRPVPLSGANQPPAVTSVQQEEAVDEPIPGATEPPILSEGSAQASLVGCIKATSSASASGVVAQISSVLTLRVRADGSVQSGRFDPPLKPELHVCANGIMGGRFAPGARTISIPVSIGR